MIFRGMTYRRVKNYLGTGWAVGISSVLFGIYHGNTIQFLYAAVLGILLAVLYEYSQSLLVPVLAHMAANLWAIYSGGCITLLAGMIPQAKILLLAAEGLVAVVCIFVLFLKQTGDNR
nr:CPBP family intramembrane glutamic endopeptidase [Wansuia hejianensis]